MDDEFCVSNLRGVRPVQRQYIGGRSIRTYGDQAGGERRLFVRQPDNACCGRRDNDPGGGLRIAVIVTGPVPACVVSIGRRVNTSWRGFF